MILDGFGMDLGGYEGVNGILGTGDRVWGDLGGFGVGFLVDLG